MSIYRALEFPLNEVLSVIKPRDNDRVTRVHIINEFQAVVNSVESLRGATIVPFGSFVSDLYSRWGDLDISVELPSASYVLSARKRQKQNVLRDILRALRKKGGVRNVEFIPMARVPLLKFESSQYNISCDISISNSLGPIKSKFLFWISQMDDRFRDMVLLIKEWAKARNINDPKAGTLNSYSLSLLVIFHFQTCLPPILPPLQEIYPENIANDLTGIRVHEERRIQETCAANIARFRSNRFRNANQRSLSELFVSFFKKFSEINLKESKQAICTFTGQLEDMKSSIKWMSKTYPLLVEDPFDQPENAARAVAVHQLTRIAEAFEETYRRLIIPNQYQSSLIASFTRPEIRSQLSARTPIAYPSTSGGHLGTRPQPVRAEPSLIQNSFQRMQLETRPSVVSLPTPGQTARQQIWRPRYT